MGKLVHQYLHVQYSTISAAPAFLPSAPLASSPSLPPDIEPLFPTPNGVAPSPTDSSMPTIPSSPSPPNPDNIVAPAPGFAFSPSNSPLPSFLVCEFLLMALFLVA
ncbi:hypothetical protein E1A91_D08G087100v1 [Gossypium mustelinum]|uniref:Uncharacterized protein n=3 Tax=Gossypium TaxID=3633 RepID=A0A0D2MVI8_GOSRA|nr:hypothetical protein ES319_D08G084600v1 [Gossypium barbadense]KJB23177.1 hypothetical protein B456_004G085600 [Gossypium raimondii]TYI68403.1 hypothetical protein E1A91_D08G087100v1 [Gossypium mustelinum]